MDFTQYGPTGAVVVVVILFLNFIRNEGHQRDETYNKVATALNRLTLATQKNTEATKSADVYLRQRNGRDIEKHTELLKATEEIPKTMQKIADEQAVALLQAIQNQEVKEQRVEHQTVKEQS